jgi:hypothetical protein
MDDSSEVHLNFALAKVVTTTGSKSYFSCTCASSKPAKREGFLLSEHTLTFIHEWFPRRLVSTGVSQVVTTIASNSVSLEVGLKPTDNIFAVYGYRSLEDRLN